MENNQELERVILDVEEVQYVGDLLDYQLEMYWDAYTEEELKENWEDFVKANKLMDKLVSIGKYKESTYQAYVLARQYYKEHK